MTKGLVAFFFTGVVVWTVLKVLAVLEVVVLGSDVSFVLLCKSE